MDYTVVPSKVNCTLPGPETAWMDFESDKCMPVCTDIPDKVLGECTQPDLNGLASRFWAEVSWDLAEFMILSSITKIP